MGQNKQLYFGNINGRKGIMIPVSEKDIIAIKQKFQIIGNASKLNNAIRIAIQVGGTDLSVLITGESGTGKESFSKIIHSLSHRKHGQFIAINCGAIPEGTIDSELFGHEKGAFTGAQEQRKGYFEVTNKGTLFLDEIGEMPLSTQARLLRVLENGEFIKVGASKVQKTDVRVIAATNVNLMEALNKGKFREDLYYRLSTVPIYVPSLRERGDDLLLLFRKFANDLAEVYRNQPIDLTEDAQHYIKNCYFPGNIRQLKNLVQQISVLELERMISAQILRKYIPSERNLPALIPSKNENTDNLSERDLLYKILFDMKNDMNEMKKLVHQILKNEGNNSEILKKHNHLFKNIETPQEVSLPTLPNATPTFDSLPKNKPPDDTPQDPTFDDEIDFQIEDVVQEIEEKDSLSLEKNEKEMILKALSKNKNKRKYAAQDLGISERTLYRKIKQYEIDN